MRGIVAAILVRRIFRLESMPHNAHGKIDRAGLKERMAEDTKSHRR